MLWARAAFAHACMVWQAVPQLHRRRVPSKMVHGHREAEPLAGLVLREADAGMVLLAVPRLRRWHVF